MIQTRDQIAIAFKGQSFDLPNFDTIHQNWPFATSPHIDWLKEESDKWIQWLSTQKWIIVSDIKKICKKLKAINIEIYLANAFPDESRETLQALLFSQLWMFLWDDEVDSVSGELGENYEAAQKFRKATLQYMKYALNLTNDTTSLSDDVLITSFSTVADPLLDCPEETRKDLYIVLEQAINAIGVEHKLRLNPYLPDTKTYLDNRVHSIGLPTTKILHCMLIGSRIYAMDRPEMKEMIYHSSIMPGIMNDIISLRKELKTGIPDSLVPILWQDERDVQKAIDKACSMMEDSRKAFDRAESVLLHSCSEEELKEVMMFSRACKTQVTGNYVWMLEAKRYGLAEFNVNGKYHIKLD